MHGEASTKTSSVSHGELNRLDFSVAYIFFLVSQELIQSTKKCEIVYAPESDHSAVSLVLQSNHLNQKRGPGFWKFNTALLKDEAYVTALKIHIPIFKDKYNETHDLGLKWDLIKREIRGFTIMYSKRKAKKFRDEERLLHKKINDLHVRAENNLHNRNILLELSPVPELSILPAPYRG